MKLLAKVILLMAFPLSAWAQTVCTINANVNWSSCTCSETGSAPVNGNKIVVSAGRTLTINVNSPVPFFIGDIDVLGTLISDRNGAQLNGNIRVLSGGTFDLAKKLDLGSSGGCGFTVIIDNGGSLTFSGGGASSLLSVCGNPVAQGGGSCSTFPNGAPPFCGGTLPPGGGFVLDETGNGGINYIWKGTTSNWTTSTNWTPTRTTLTNDDFLTFNSAGNTGGNFTVTNIPTQSVGKIVVTGSSTYSFTSTASNTLTLTSLIGNAFQIDNGSTLSVGSGSFALNVTMPTNGLAEVGGQLNLTNGNFGVGNAILTLHTNPTPLARTSGQVSMNSSSILNFGNLTNITGATIVLPNSIFVSAPTISSLVINRTNGASLGDQSITVATSATFTLGNLTTNSAGRIRFSPTASNPVESTASKIIGYAEMNSRSVGIGALNFLGFTMASGANNIGNMTISRRTGASGINTFNSNQSIASTWEITSSSEPAAGRNISFGWQSAFDNVTNSVNRFQIYFFNSGPGWTTLGALQFLAAQGPPRQTATVSTTKLTDTFTVSDETQVLPIELISFNAISINDEVGLTWVTASELNNDFFTIERLNLEDDKFDQIATVKGSGTINETRSYQAYDFAPRTGKNYYRLKQTDLDGQFSYSKIVMVDFQVPDEVVSIYPNPTNQETITVWVKQLKPGQQVPLQIRSAMGAQAFSKTFTADTNGNIKTLIEVDKWAQGLYLIQIGIEMGIQRKIIIE
jgi:hypothetical protein